MKLWRLRLAMRLLASSLAHEEKELRRIKMADDLRMTLNTLDRAMKDAVRRGDVPT